MSMPTRIALAAALAATAACGRGDRGSSTDETAARPADTAAAQPAPNPNELRVTTVMVGKRIGPDKRITEPTFQFAPTDTIYASILTEGTPPEATLSAKWIFQNGKTVDSSATTIQPKGIEATEFHISQAKGLPEGTYMVQIWADGDSVDTKTFQVKRAAR